MSRSSTSLTPKLAILALLLAVRQLSRNFSKFSFQEKETRESQNGGIAAPPPAQAPPTESTTSTRDSIALIRDLGLIFAILVFFIGWLFSYIYLHNFGIPIYILETPVYSFYFQSINAILHAAYRFSTETWIIILAVSFLLLLLCSWSTRARSFLHHHSIALLLLITFTWLIGGFFLVRSAALEAASAIRNGQAPTVKFEFKKDGSLADANVRPVVNAGNCPSDQSSQANMICRANLENRLFLVAESKTHYMVLVKTKLPPHAPPELKEEDSQALVYHIPVSEVAAALITPTALDLTPFTVGGRRK